MTGYDHSIMRNAPLTEQGVVTEEQLWDALKYFLERVVPVAENSRARRSADSESLMTRVYYYKEPTEGGKP